MSPGGENCTFFSCIFFVVVGFVVFVLFFNGLPDSRVESKAR